MTPSNSITISVPKPKGISLYDYAEFLYNEWRDASNLASQFSEESPAVRAIWAQVAKTAHTLAPKVVNQ